MWGKEIRFRPKCRVGDRGGPVQTARRAGVFALPASLRVVRALARGGGERELEIVVLRHQLAILRRGGKRPRYTTVDRALLAAVSRLLPPERWSCFAVSPQTLRRWHRALLAGGRRRCRRTPGRPPLAAETRGLIRRLARENPRWGYMRIEGELLKLGIGVSATTIATVLRSSGLGPAPQRIGPSWSEFPRAQAHSLVGGGLSSALGDDCLEADAPEPGGPAPVGEARQVEADDNRSLAAAAEPRLASRPPPVRRRSARPCVPQTTRASLRPSPSHRSHARDGPQRETSARPTTQCSKRDVKATADRGRPRPSRWCTRLSGSSSREGSACCRRWRHLQGALRRRLRMMDKSRRELGGRQSGSCGREVRGGCDVHAG